MHLSGAEALASFRTGTVRAGRHLTRCAVFPRQSWTAVANDWARNSQRRRSQSRSSVIHKAETSLRLGSRFRMSLSFGQINRFACWLHFAGTSGEKAGDNRSTDGCGSNWPCQARQAPFQSADILDARFSYPAGASVVICLPRHSLGINSAIRLVLGQKDVRSDASGQLTSQDRYIARNPVASPSEACRQAASAFFGRRCGTEHSEHRSLCSRRAARRLPR